jgi:hypothetical protein
MHTTYYGIALRPLKGRHLTKGERYPTDATGVLV